MRRIAALLLALVLPAGCAAPGFVETPAAIQPSVRSEIPHVDRTGHLLGRYDSDRSFFPIGMYHALIGRYAGRDYDLSTLAALGFNTVHPWEGLELAPFLEAARAAGVQVIPNAAVRPEALSLAADPAILAWYLEEEPVARAGDGAVRLRDFERRKAEFAAADPGRAHLVVETSLTQPPYREAFDAWARRADIFGLTVYPIVEDVGVEARRSAIAYPRGIPETIAAAFSANRPPRPVWLFVQAFSSPMHMPRQRWLMPTPVELRAMVYAGLVHGATGIFIFAQDSFVTRAGMVVGIGPDIPTLYDHPFPDILEGRSQLGATDDEIASARNLWAALPQLNAEIRTLAPSLLQPGPDLTYRVAVSGPSARPAPIRTLLKRLPDGTPVLLAVNVEARPFKARFTFGGPVARIVRMFDAEASPRLAADAFEDAFAPYGVRVYRLENQP
ncbi:MAG: hypothetical protein HY059_17620 [Proteobacteria bacterium]|nr:hypothetical protein [Pseudomonadota bacterium]